MPAVVIFDPSCAGSTRASIEKVFTFAKRWIAGSSPAMTETLRARMTRLDEKNKKKLGLNSTYCSAAGLTFGAPTLCCAQAVRP
jgi:hypothetical protein